MNNLEIPKIKSKIEIGMSLWVLNTSKYTGELYSITEIIVTGFYLNEYNNYIILCDRESTCGYQYSELRKTIFFTLDSAKQKVIKLKARDILNAKLEAEQIVRDEENNKRCTQWLIDHGDEYIGKEVMVKIGHDDYLHDTIKSLHSLPGSTIKDIYFCGNTYWNIYKLKRENKTWYFITTETKIADRKKLHDKEVAKYKADIEAIKKGEK